MQEKSFHVTMIASILKLCPESVTKAFDAMMLEPDESKKKSLYLDLCVALKGDIAEIEREIETIF